MSLAFEIVRSPDDAALDSLARLRSDDPFASAAYAHAQRRLGFEPCILALRESGGAAAMSCLGLFKKGRLGGSFDIPWLPTLPADSSFWPGLVAACKKMGVWDLSVRTFNAPAVPALGAECGRETGIEYRLDISGPSPLVPTSTNHRRSVTKARKLGVVIRRVRTPDAIAVHLSLMQASMDRRAARGESVPDKWNTKFYEALLASGAAEFAQALLDGVVTSSIFLMRSPGGAYYQTAGTSPEGMSAGTSPFLIVELAEALRGEGATSLDLGGATPAETGLSRFKSGFGAAEIPFEIANFFLASPLARKLRTVLRLARHDPGALVREVVDLDHYCVFSTPPGDITAPECDEQIKVTRLGDDELRALCAAKPEFHRQAERIDEFGFNDAFGLFVGGELAHVSWLVTPEHDRLLPEREVMLREGEAEITHCHTAEAFRGKGIYPLAVRTLCQHAAASGVRRVFMVTHPQNAASLRGIEKAGLKPAGSIHRLRMPFLFKDRVLRWRGHR